MNSEALSTRVRPGMTISISVLNDDYSAYEEVIYSESDELGLIVYSQDAPNIKMFFPWSAIERIDWLE